MKRLVTFFLLCASSVLGQSNSGELRVAVTDPAGLGVRATLHITSDANQYRNVLTTNEQGTLNVQRLPYGIYQVEVEQAGFATVSETVEIRSSIPKEYRIQLKLSSVNQSVTVSAPNTLIDPDRAGAVNEIGPDLIQNRLY